MMLFQLLPFFLAAQVSDKDGWKYGPEYTFLGEVKMITSLDSDKGQYLGTGLYSKLRCRPREPDVLRCKLDDTKITRLDVQGGFNPEKAKPAANETFRPFNAIPVPFEIKFNDRGIESYIIEKNEPSLPDYCVNMARLIANQLSIGADLSDEMRSTYRSFENFTVGECDVDFKVTRLPNKDSEAIKDSKFELTPLDKLGKLANEIMEIEKERNVKECLRCVRPFFGTRYTLGLVYRDVLSLIKSSVSKIVVSKNKFVSETNNENDVFDQDRRKLGKVLDHMKLTLESVLPATDQLEKFNNPVVKGVLPENLDDDPSQY
ncbi:uncharacterized protein LOC130663876 isoform X2 [Microplitis mediator]|uniref:uncharacterized protein LOC130663876 isoform X2 n=1 Tax=Microplitis mediator TaxID=375433 RepID=UPI002552D93A|nr:uncharacterized protein LOC130663876 isoform X2 [Microplitis mediator]